MEAEKVLGDKNWEPMIWLLGKGKQSVSGFGYVIKPANLKANEKALVAFSVTLPEGTEIQGIPQFLASHPGPQRRNTDKVVVTYKVIGREIQETMVIPLNSGNRRIDPNNFGVHAYTEKDQYVAAQKFQPRMI